VGGNTFYQIPIESDGTTTRFGLEEIAKEETRLIKAGEALLGVGALTALGAYLYDVYHGVGVIGSKRDKAPYKAGRAIQAQIRRS